MKKENLFNLAMALVVVAMVLFMSSFGAPAMAADEMLLKADRIEFRQDKNGKEYCFMTFASAKKSASGLAYNESIVGTIPSWEKDALAAAKKLKPGQPIVVVATKSQYNGNDTLRIKAVGPAPAGK